MIRIAIDAMGGDHGLEVTIAAVASILEAHNDVTYLLVGKEPDIHAALQANSISAEHPRIEIVHASEVVGMEEVPAQALRQKKDSSMRVAINLVRDDRADACVSAGNTGALMATAKFVLKTISGISRPALCACLPSKNGRTYVLDLGANVDSSSDVLFQFGLMGSVLIQCVEGVSRPSIGLLNIGVEETKGNDTIKAASDLFRSSDLNYIGYVEADEIYTGTTDLVVCDGFVGNIALKSSEGVAQMILSIVKEEYTRNLGAKAAALISKGVLNAVKGRIDHRKYNGASLLGLRGAVVKSHGSTNAFGFSKAIEVAIEEARNDLVDRIDQAMSAVM